MNLISYGQLKQNKYNTLEAAGVVWVGLTANKRVRDTDKK